MKIRKLYFQNLGRGDKFPPIVNNASGSIPLVLPELDYVLYCESIMYFGISLLLTFEFLQMKSVSKFN